MLNKKIYIYLGIFSLIILFLIIGIYILNLNKTNEDELYFEEGLFIEESSENINVVNNISKIKVHITGEVANEGIIELEEGARIDDAIKMAGNTTINADLSKVNLAYELSDGQKLYIPSLNEEIEEYTFMDAGENVLEESEAINGKININIADVSALQTINGIGESLAEKIIAYREENGKFKSVEELKNVSGIGDKKYKDIKDKVVVK